MSPLYAGSLGLLYLLQKRRQRLAARKAGARGDEPDAKAAE